MDINLVIFTGRLTRDIDLRKTSTGKSCVNFNVACDRGKDKDGNDKADFINCVAWEKTAETLAKYAKKGSRVAVQGRVQTRNYEGKNGTEYITEILVTFIKLFDFRQEENAQEYTHPRSKPEVRDESVRNIQQTLGGDAFPNRDEYGNIEVETDDLPFY